VQIGQRMEREYPVLHFLRPISTTPKIYRKLFLSASINFNFFTRSQMTADSPGIPDYEAGGEMKIREHSLPAGRPSAMGDVCRVLATAGRLA